MNHAHEAKLKGQKSIQEILNGLNVMGYEADFISGFVAEFNRSHRTLQQNVGRLIVALIHNCAEEYRRDNYDLRNAAFLKLCSELDSKCEDTCLPFI